MESGNPARTETVVHLPRLRKEKIKGKKSGNARRRHAGDFFETDAFIAQFRMGELLLRRCFLAQMGNCMRVGRLLCE